MAYILLPDSGTPPPHSRHSPTRCPCSATAGATHSRHTQRNGRCGVPRTLNRPHGIPNTLHVTLLTTTERLLDLVPIQDYNSFASLFRASSKALNAGVVAATTATRLRYWNAWRQWVRAFHPISPTLCNASRQDTTAILAAWAQHVRQGGLQHRRATVRAQTVQVALRAIGTTIELDGKPNPLGGTEKGYPKALRQQLEGYTREDPPPTPRLAVPVDVPRLLYANGQLSTNPKTRTIGQLAIVGFFFLLRVGEYTYHREADTRRTHQFTLKDVTLWQNTHRLSLDTPRAQLLATCTAATLSINNQKNGMRNQSVHQETNGTDLCPVKALIHHVTYLWHHTRDLNTKLGTYFVPPQTPRQIASADISRAIKRTIVTLGLPRQGLTPQLVGSHSLRAGGAMAMYLNGIPHDTIRKLGRWQSDTFLMYIHEQIAALSANVSTRMSRHIPFHNVLSQR